MDFCGRAVRFLSTGRTFADDCGRVGSSRGFESHLLRQPFQSASRLDSKAYPDVFFDNVDSRTLKFLCFLSLLTFVSLMWNFIFLERKSYCWIQPASCVERGRSHFFGSIPPPGDHPVLVKSPSAVVAGLQYRRVTNLTNSKGCAIVLDMYENLASAHRA
jgi:hypothetical protein